MGKCLSNIIEDCNIDAVRRLIDDAKNIVITCHVSPDGDAIGSSLALMHVLTQINKNVAVVTPDQCPKSLLFLPGTENIIPYSVNKITVEHKIQSADLIFCLDFNSLYRVDKMEQVLNTAIATKVLIDHHLEPEEFATIKISRPELSSTCLLLYYVLFQLGYSNFISKDVATCIYAGMMTDTGNFSYNSSDEKIYLVIADLVSRGIEKDDIYNRIYNTNNESRLRICGYALSEKLQLFKIHKAALITLTKEELAKFQYEKGDTEGLVNIPLSIPEIEYSAFFREDDEYVKISMRSIGDFPVNKLCEQYFNGGGHKNAAGGEFYGSIVDAENLFKSTLFENDKYFNNDDK